MPSPQSVRPSLIALSETTLSLFSSSTWSAVTGGFTNGIMDAMLPIVEAMPKGSEISARSRQVTRSTVSRQSRKVITSAPPSS
ncbi:hypothetical protein D3C80_1916680 [compost metagenome]